MPNLQLKHSQRILFTGDSITDAGRREPAYRPLGFGYVNFAANWLLAKHPTLNLTIINTGISGDTTLDLERRWKRDCLDHRPDLLSVLIGINDVWQQSEGPDVFSAGAGPHEYEVTYRRLLSQTRAQLNCQIVLAEPFMFCADKDNPTFALLAHYISVVHKLAAEFDAVLVPLQQAIDEQIASVPAQRWSLDMVHPELWAHAWIAQQWLGAVGP